MKYRNSILGIGIAIVLIPMLGFPPVWSRFIIVILGLWLCAIVVLEKYGQNFVRKIPKRERKPVRKISPSPEIETEVVGVSEISETTNTNDQNQTV